MTFSKRTIAIALTVMVLASIIPVSGAGVMAATTNGLGDALPPVLLPIRVNNDAQLASIASSGSGTPISPYIIQFKNITTSGEVPGIYIGNTSACFILTNCNVHGGTDGSVSEYMGGAGLLLYNVSSAIVNMNDFSNNFIGVMDLQMRP